MFSGLESPMHLVVVLVIAILVLGPKKLPEVGRSLGASMRGFKASLEGREKTPAAIPVVPAEAPIVAAEPADAPEPPVAVAAAPPVTPSDTDS